MSRKFTEYKEFNLSEINKEVLKLWQKEDTFSQSLETRQGKPAFVFYEGPPSANGMPGIHHVIARTIKDIFCRYKTQQNHLVRRKAGWDTHGLPVELGVEKMLGITKEAIGKTITVKQYNDTCKEEVMRYTDHWRDITEKMGYWVDLENPYITYDNRYIETLWWILKEFYKKGLLYKGYTIQPFSPAAGTGLSSHELNLPGCYRDVKDTTVTAQFKIVRNQKSEFLFADTDTPVYALAWTTTPWTLPSNTALALGAKITYVKVRTFNAYTGEPVTLILAKDLMSAHFSPKAKDLALEDYKLGDKHIPYRVLAEYTGSRLEGIRYEQLIQWIQPNGDAFRMVLGDFVTTEDGTGIVHIAPTFGADDDRVGKAAGIAPLHLVDTQKMLQPMVDRQGRFFTIEDLDEDFIHKFVNVEAYKEFAGRFVKNDYDKNLTENDPTLDVDIAVMLKKENKAFRVEKHEHNYPHCWRTDKPILYYPLDSWFVKTTAYKQRMVELNKTINWKPEATGTGRFGQWLENLVDWNLSRSRYWGTPLPIWRSEDGKEEICIGSVAELKGEIEKSVAAGYMTENPLKDFKENDFSNENYNKFDLHRPFVDEIILVSDSGQPMNREADLIDVWFDSGAMPYAQLHYPFENKDFFHEFFPADFISEGVDQTRGWFYTLHAISTMLMDSVAFKNIVSTGLITDANGVKMSKRLGNVVDPFQTIEQYGSDPLRWYMMANAAPWESLKFNLSGVDEVRRKFFGTLYNTYSFFALYANIDQFTNTQEQIPLDKRPEIDRWVLSLLNSLVRDVEIFYEDYEPTRATRAIQNFVIENLSNWYVRLNRKRFWGQDYNENKIAAYQTLHTCLITIAKLMAPVAPFYGDMLYRDLNLDGHINESVHITRFPKFDATAIDKDLEERMALAQKISSMVLSLRRKESIKVRQPLNKIMIPVLDKALAQKIEQVKAIILTEVNIKDVEYLEDTTGVIVKQIKANFKMLGKKYGKQMKAVAAAISAFNQQQIALIEQEGSIDISFDDTTATILLDEVEITTKDIPGWTLATEGRLTVALDITITPELRQEGIAREFVNRIQNIRKDSGLEVTDKIDLLILKHDGVNQAIENYGDYIASQTLANSIKLIESANGDNDFHDVEIDNEIKTKLKISK